MSSVYDVNPATLVLNELNRLRVASEEAMKRYLEFQRQIIDLQLRLEARPDGTLGIKAERFSGAK